MTEPAREQEIEDMADPAYAASVLDELASLRAALATLQAQLRALRRYTCDTGGGIGADGGWYNYGMMQPASDGEYVRYTDLAALLDPPASQEPKE